MPGLTGLQFIKSMTEKPMFILVTAYEKYALEGYSLDVVDYLLKPVSLDRFIKAANKAYELHQLKLRGNEIPETHTPAEYFFVNVDYSLLKINFADILFIEGLKDYVKIHLESTTKPVVTRMSMKSLEESLPANKFLRVHKSYIISVLHVNSLRKSSIFIGPHEIPVSEAYRDAITTLTGKQG